MIRKILCKTMAVTLAASLVVPAGVYAAAEPMPQASVLSGQEESGLNLVGPEDTKDVVLEEDDSEEPLNGIPEETISPSPETTTPETPIPEFPITDVEGEDELNDEQEQEIITPSEVIAEQRMKISEVPSATTTAPKAKARWEQQGGRWRYYNAKGQYIKSAWQQVEGKWYYFDADGWMVSGWKLLNKKWYYFRTSSDSGTTGSMVTGWLTLKGKVYYLKKTGSVGTKGKMLTGWHTISKKVYYFDSSGTIRKGWQQFKGKWFYFKKGGSQGTQGQMLTGWQKLGGQIYYLKKSGAHITKGKMLTGWQTINKKVFYFNSSGAMLTEWQNLKGKWFYFKKSGSHETKGQMLTGWQKLGGKVYYMKKTGACAVQGKMLTGWHTLDKKRFYFNSSGVLLTGWQTLSGKKYYLDPNGGYGQLGAMYANGTFSIGGVKYYFDANGVCTGVSGSSLYLTDPADGKTRLVEPQIITDPQIGKDVTEDEFFAAALYTEAGDQGLDGQIMVALTILNRIDNAGFPSSLKFVIYSKGQFEVAQNGTLTTWLERIRDNDPKCSYLTKYKTVEAVKQARKIFNAYKKNGTPRKILKAKDFSYLFFMTHNAFERLNLDSVKCDVYRYEGHIFFRNWVKK